MCQTKLPTGQPSNEIVFDAGDNNNTTTLAPVSEALREQLFSNFFSMLLHLSETDAQIVRVSVLLFNYDFGTISFYKFSK